jgi:hypothetical protein
LRSDVLELLLAHVIDGEIELAAHIFINPTRDANAAGLRQPLQTRRDVRAVPEDVIAAKSLRRSI